MEPSTNLRINIRGKGIDKYPAKSHAQRVAAKLKIDKCLIVLQGERAQNFSNSDMPRPFRQDRYFYYLTGCNEPGCYVTYNTDLDKLILWLPPIDLRRVYYDGRGSTVEEAMELYDVDEAIYIEGKKKKSNLSHMVKDHHEAGGRCLFMRSKMDVVEKPLRLEMKQQGRPGLKLRRAMNACRAVKDEHEIELIRNANAVSAKAHTNVLDQLHLLRSEPAVESVFVGTCIAHQAREQAYPPICGSGPNAGQLHYVDNNEKFDDRQVLLIDAGAEWKDYASDVTRTMPINFKNPGHWQSSEAEVIYKQVEKIQESCISKLGPGTRFVDVWFHSIHLAIYSLLELGILKGEHKDIFEAGTWAAFYPHGLGHHVGLEVHDVQPPIKAKAGTKKKDRRLKSMHRAYRRFAKSSLYPSGLDSASTPLSESKNFSICPSQCLAPNTASDPALKPGMVVTIEPGLYFNQFILDTFFLNEPEHSKFINEDVVKKYMHVGGVRIEDDILITKNGYENLTTAPKGEEMLKIIRESAENSEQI